VPRSPEHSPIIVAGRATFDRSRRYRYTLTRRFHRGDGRVCFCMLNPSTADARTSDPTVRRCEGFAVRWGYAELEVVNIFALRSTDPAALRRAADPVGPGADAAIRRAAQRAGMVVAAWGAHGALGGRGDRVLAMLDRIGPVWTLGETIDGSPKHPLYLSAETVPVRR